MYTTVVVLVFISSNCTMPHVLQFKYMSVQSERITILAKGVTYLLSNTLGTVYVITRQSVAVQRDGASRLAPKYPL